MLGGLAQCEQKYPTADAVIRQPGVKDNLVSQKLHLEDRLKKVNEALEALENNPEFAKCLELVMKANY